MTEPLDDRLGTLRARLDEIEAVPLDDRPELFTEVNSALVAELSRLEEV